MLKLKYTGGSPDAVITVTPRAAENTPHLLFIDVHMTLPFSAVPEEFQVCWETPTTDVYSCWGPSHGSCRTLGADWNPRATHARLANWMPVQCLLSMSGRNRMTVAISDASTPTYIAAGVREEDGLTIVTAAFFTAATAPRTEYNATIRVDFRDIPYWDALYSVTDWWENDCGYTPAPVPEYARLPMNSLWYSFHQVLEPDAIVEQCRLSKPLGMETVIIDDGWQTRDSARGYAFCGDWRPERMPDMARLVRRIHETGMKVMLWYSVPFVGIHSRKYEEFKTMFLQAATSDVFVLDPRYPAVRDYLTETYVTAVRSWGLDGLKLDFIDSFVLHKKTEEPDPRRDYISLEEAVDALMCRVNAELRSINPDILIEFRQAYVGPSIRKYGNMLRVGDCPADASRNRCGIIDLRLTSGHTAVHSDMLMWHTDEPKECVALQIIPTLYSVPQISMLIDKLPEEHYKTLQYYLSFWRQHRDILLDGKLWALNPETCYSLVCAEKEGKAVFTAYDNTVIPAAAYNDLVAVNASRGTDMYIKSAKGKNYHVTDCTGAAVAHGTIENDLTELSVPVGGMVFVGNIF